MFAYGGIAVIAVAALYGLHRLFLWMEDRGWVYYWRKRGSGNAGNILMPVQAIYQPEVHYVLEERVRNRTEAEQDETGDPPNRNNDETDDNETRLQL